MVHHRNSEKWRNFILAFAASAAVLSLIMVATVMAVQPQMPQALDQVQKTLSYQPQASDSLTIILIGTGDTGASEFLLIRFNPQYGQVPLSLLPPETVVTHREQQMTLAEVYQSGGGSAVKQALAERLGIVIDRYACLSESTFVQIAKRTGSVVYTLPYDMEYKNRSGYSIQIPKGERKLDGQDIAYILQYPGFDPAVYEKSQIAGSLIAAVINQNLQVAKTDTSEAAFKLVVNLIDTDISFADYEYRKESADVMSTLDVTVAGNLTIDGIYLGDGSEFELSERYIATIQQYFEAAVAA